MKYSPKVIAFVGMLGSGKGTCTTYLAETKHWPVIHFGNMMYEEVERRGLDIVKDEKMVREDMRRQDGPAVLAKRVAEHVRDYIAKGEKVIVLDGLYSWSEYKYLEEQFGEQLTVIAITAPKKLRRQRALERKDKRRTYTYDQLVTREVAEIENLEKGGPIAYADYTLTNTETQDTLFADLEVVLRDIGL
ncbi:MAG TPA: AAA family ATPase [Candidatus Saccharimonadales bacterium]|nr:AAA family ATPase [Candidatus Saccharimonadales bacterium]